MVTKLKKVTREMILKKLAQRAGTRVYHDESTKRAAVRKLLANPGSGYAISYDLGIRPTLLYSWAQDPSLGGVPKEKRKGATRKGAKGAKRKGATRATRKGAKRKGAKRKGATRPRPTQSGATRNGGSTASRYRYR